MIESELDETHYYILNPILSQTENIFFAESMLSLKDKWWDFFEMSEYELNLFEFTRQQYLSSWIPPLSEDYPRSDRSYVSIFLRADAK